MAELKTKPTSVSVEGFLNKVADARKRADSFRLLEMMKEITGAEPRMWGPTMVGFGDYHYVYPSGHEGDCFMTGFSPRKDALTVYFEMGFFEHAATLLKKLGKCKLSKCCMYIKRLDDVDLGVLRKLIDANFKRVTKMGMAREKKAAKKPNPRTGTRSR